MNQEDPFDREGTVPPWREAMWFWIKLGCISFGGPAGQIAIMHKELVEQKRWITESQFTHALNFCMILPGPEAQQLATYLGWRMHGTRGGIFAGVWFILPSALLLLGLSWLAMIGAHWTWLQSLFLGLQAAVIALIAEALVRMGKKVWSLPSLKWIAPLSWILMQWANVSFIAIVVMAGLIGFWHSRHASATPAATNQTPTFPIARLLRVAGIGLSLWLLPMAVLCYQFGVTSLFAKMGLFFTKAAWVTFGGAYAVLPYVAQQAVEHYHWLSHEQMMTGLALAETTPGPLIMVLQFVGFVAAWQDHSDLTPLVSACLGAAVTTWFTFLPSFLMIFATAPYLERWTQQPRLRGAMQAISAAVMGVMAQLFWVLLQHSWFGAPSSPQWTWIGVSLLAFLLLKKTRLGAVSVILLSALAGYLLG